MLYTVEHAVPFLKPFVDNGTCDSTKVIARLNEATRRLLAKPNTPVNTLRRMRYCTTNNTITLPREAEKITHLTIDCAPSQVFDIPYEFLSDGPGEFGPDAGFCHDFGVDMGDGYPSFFEIPCKEYTDEEDGCCCDEGTLVPRYLAAFATVGEDAGKEMRLLGKDLRAADILTDGVPGEVLKINRWKGGVEGAVDANTVIHTTQLFKELKGVIKPVTKGFVSLYTFGWETPEGETIPVPRMFFLGKYHPDETHPGYRRYRLTKPGFQQAKNVLAIVKLRYVPAKHDNDILLIQNLDALKCMVMAITRESEREFEEAQMYEMKAVQMLKDQYTNNKTHATHVQMSMAHGFRGINII